MPQSFLVCCLRQGSWFCRCQAKAPWGFAGLPESQQAGPWSACLCITHRNYRNIFPIYCDSDGSAMVETSGHFILEKLAEECCLSAYSNSSMRQWIQIFWGQSSYFHFQSISSGWAASATALLSSSTKTCTSTMEGQRLMSDPLCFQSNMLE